MTVSQEQNGACDANWHDRRSLAQKHARFITRSVAAHGNRLPLTVIVFGTIRNMDQLGVVGITTRRREILFRRVHKTTSSRNRVYHDFVDKTNLK